MAETAALLALACQVARRAGERLLDTAGDGHKQYVHSTRHPREIKAAADTVLERDILEALRPTGITILSEESGLLPGAGPSPLRFLVDPLDGTFNFVKGLGPSAVSIALWHGDTPVFGVIFNLLDRRLTSGGPGLGAVCDGRPIAVSATATPGEGAICTGFPVRFDLGSDEAARRFMATVRPFAKVRMIGSAAASLLLVATGAAEVYTEQAIMLWDVAAGIAIVEGAGGRVEMRPGTDPQSLDVFASNGRIPVPPFG